MTAVARLNEAPYALSAPPAPDTSPATGASETEVAIVGAGYGGLIAALTLARRGVDVMVLEAETVGFGGSGRNHGQCIPIFPYLREDRLTPEGFALLRDSGRRVFDLITEHDIACEAVQSGTLHTAHDAAGLDRLRAQQAAYHRLDKAGPLLDTEATAALTGTDRYLGGWVHPDGGHLNPLAYARGLARAAIAAGVRLHTGTPIRGVVRRDRRWTLRCDDAEVRARRVGFAVNGYAGAGTPKTLRAAHVPLVSYGIASAPLGPDLRATIMPGGHNAGDTHCDPMFFRIDAAGRIVTGGLKEVRRGRDFAYTATFMTRRFVSVFPQLDGLRWTHLWTGTLAVSTDRMPHILVLDDGLYALMGFTGRGVPTTAALGEAFSTTLAAPEEGRRLWPASKPGAILARRAIGALVQNLRGPWNQFRDRL